ncbi:hypothetical protein EDD37DRAFT_607988 [Exophiala viscosa]|uniref:Uncharacterized protein n=1 Tax=Exophiala viscosa TaxID=2486360 RepID=A0AAN6DVC2_9EURO|nr:hypothetical protein EDD36DRAFT_419487 [Exophiala viscosa]KAI1626423.1 hypothetical protein EDD37DRAFT_607988 [Exophiala viscosa]
MTPLHLFTIVLSILAASVSSVPICVTTTTTAPILPEITIRQVPTTTQPTTTTTTITTLAATITALGAVPTTIATSEPPVDDHTHHGTSTTTHSHTRIAASSPSHVHASLKHLHVKNSTSNISPRTLRKIERKAMI